MTRILRIPGRQLVAAAAIAIAALTASACGQVQAGSAAVVGDRRISVAELQAATTQIQTYAGPDQQVSQNKVLLLMILEPYLVRAAAKGGVGVSQDQATQELKAHSVARPGAGAVQAIRALTALNNLQQAGKQEDLTALADQIRGDRIEVNPRYGRFDPKTLDVVATTPDWLVASPTATPSSGSGQTPAPSSTP